MGQFPAGKLRLWAGQPVNAPFVTPPLSLRVALVMCILSVTGTLIYGVAVQLRTSTNVAVVELVYVTVLHFLLPLLIAWSIAVNRQFSRPLLAIYTLLVTFEAFFWIRAQSWPQQNQTYAWLGLATAVLLVFVWLYATLRMRIYYALISGRALPDGLPRSAEEILQPGRFEKMFGRLSQFVAPYFEFLAVLIVILALVLALSF